MGDIVRVQDGEVELAIGLATAAPIERVDVMNGADPIETLRCYRADDLGRRLRITWYGAEYRGRGRNTYWEGEIAVSGARIEAMTPVNRWNFDRPLELLDDNRIRFEAVTSGNFGGVDLLLDRAAGARVSMDTNRVSGSFAVDALGIEDLLLDAGGLERGIRLRRLPDRLRKCELATTVPVSVAPGRDNAIWVRVTTLDGHVAWSSPIYLSRSA